MVMNSLCTDKVPYRVALGYDEGTIMIKIGREEPVASMDNGGKIIWAKHNEIQTVNIKAVGADFEVIRI
jgi:coatomer subunit beta'